MFFLEMQQNESAWVYISEEGNRGVVGGWSGGVMEGLWGGVPGGIISRSTGRRVE